MIRTPLNAHTCKASCSVWTFLCSKAFTDQYQSVYFYNLWNFWWVDHLRYQTCSTQRKFWSVIKQILGRCIHALLESLTFALIFKWGSLFREHVAVRWYCPLLTICLNPTLAQRNYIHCTQLRVLAEQPYSVEWVALSKSAKQITAAAAYVCPLQLKGEQLGEVSTQLGRGILPPFSHYCERALYQVFRILPRQSLSSGYTLFIFPCSCE